MATLDGSVELDAGKMPMADPDSDGLPNLAEYAFGGNPFDSTSRIRQYGVISSTGGSGGFVFTLPVLPGANITSQEGLLTAQVNGLTCRILGGVDPVELIAPVEEVYPARESGLPAAPIGWEYHSFWIAGAGGLCGFMGAAVEVEP